MWKSVNILVLTTIAAVAVTACQTRKHLDSSAQSSLEDLAGLAGRSYSSVTGACLEFLPNQQAAYLHGNDHRQGTYSWLPQLKKIDLFLKKLPAKGSEDTSTVLGFQSMDATMLLHSNGDTYLELTIGGTTSLEMMPSDCKANPNNGPKTAKGSASVGEAVKFRVIDPEIGNWSEAARDGIFVISSEQEWDAIYQARIDAQLDPNELPNITPWVAANFKSEFVIGYQATHTSNIPAPVISQVRKQGDTLHVTVIRKELAEHCSTLPRRSAPTVLIAVPKDMPRKLKVTLTKRTVDCD